MILSRAKPSSALVYFLLLRLSLFKTKKEYRSEELLSLSSDIGNDDLRLTNIINLLIIIKFNNYFNNRSLCCELFSSKRKKKSSFNKEKTLLIHAFMGLG